MEKKYLLFALPSNNVLKNAYESKKKQGDLYKYFEFIITDITISICRNQTGADIIEVCKICDKSVKTKLNKHLYRMHPLQVPELVRLMSQETGEMSTEEKKAHNTEMRALMKALRRQGRVKHNWEVLRNAGAPLCLIPAW